MIYPFHSEGVVRHPDDFYNKQAYVESRCVSDMHNNGYAPVLDMDRDAVVEQIEGKSAYRYKVTVYGRRVPDGLDPKEYEGWLMTGVPKAAPQTEKDYRNGAHSNGRLVGKKDRA